MAITSQLGTSESTLAAEMAAGQLLGPSFVEMVSSSISMSQNATYEIERVFVSSMTLLSVASFVRSPTAPKIPLIIDEGIVRQSNTTIEIGPLSTRFISGNYTTVATDRVIVCEAALTVDLIPAVDFAYKKLDITNISTGTVVVNPDGSETIIGQSSISLFQWDSLALFSTGSNWILQ